MYRLKKKHQDLWKQISVEYMTEESDSDAEEIKQHKLQWRSESKSHLYRYVYIYIYIYMSIANLELHSLIQKLDKLQEGDLKKGGLSKNHRRNQHHHYLFLR